MKPEFQPAIEALQRDLLVQEQKIIDTKKMINQLCKMADAPEIYADLGTISQAGITSIQGDTFYGKSVNTAAREYLEMRKSANLGPASPRDVYEALKKGGFVFTSKAEANSITVVRNTMSKQSGVFHRLPTGDYGLLKWYPKAKNQKVSSTADDDDFDEIETSDPHHEESDVA